MAPLCAEFGISRKMGCKILDRYKDCGVQAFSDRSRRPHRQANRLPAPIEATIALGTPISFSSGFTGAIALGIGTAIVYPALLAAAVDVSEPGRRASTLGWYRFWRDLGYPAGALIAGFVAQASGLASAVCAAAILTLASGVVAAVCMIPSSLGTEFSRCAA